MLKTDLVEMMIGETDLAVTQFRESDIVKTVGNWKKPEYSYWSSSMEILGTGLEDVTWGWQVM